MLVPVGTLAGIYIILTHRFENSLFCTCRFRAPLPPWNVCESLVPRFDFESAHSASEREPPRRTLRFVEIRGPVATVFLPPRARSPERLNSETQVQRRCFGAHLATQCSHTCGPSCSCTTLAQLDPIGQQECGPNGPTAAGRFLDSLTWNSPNQTLRAAGVLLREGK